MAIPERAQKRLQRDYMELLSKPVDYIIAHPLEENILEWYLNIILNFHNFLIISYKFDVIH
jgi:ubiquitin-protein ligase